MADLYASYSELAAAETEGVDYERRSVPVAGATWCSIAIHGGGIEGGSGELARAVGAGLMSHYEFAGLKTSGNGDLHVTSTNFDEPQCEGIVHTARRCLSFHGYTGTPGVAETAIGGLDTDLVARVTTQLQAAGVTVIDAPSEIAGDNPDNICNETTHAAGVQLELSRAQREAFFPGGDLSRAMRDSGQRTEAFDTYAAAVRAAFVSRGLVSLGSSNVSRYCLLPSSGADVDLVASVSTDALATGGGHFLALAARCLDGSNSYLARIEFSTSQAVILTLRKRVDGSESFLAQHTTGLTHAVDRRFWIRFQVTGSTLRAKAWQDGTSEPGSWQLETTDTDLTAAGSVGMRSILSVTNSNTLPVVAAWDDFDDRTSQRQRITVVRSVNGITKSHPAGEAARLDDQNYVTL
ncbi:poly-gamma-glutamate hydrolase family protein [Streptomyces sp. NPDC048392]|uniref:poly-gamma-glutamate hydrolase family protein n=1 Tax=Streptomyces sp. NPDC048392 TaxID=3365543 RepID=UPI003718BBA9